MSTSEKVCPQCNTVINGDYPFCLNCGATIPQETTVTETKPQEDTSIKERKPERIDSVPEGDGDIISRSNITGGVNKTTNTTVNDSSTNTTNNTQNVNTNVVNHSTRTNNINNTSNTCNTIINQQAAPEFCAVCGKSLKNDNKARCPKCQKTICADCIVSGKNRCTECEKKAIDEYRMAFQELLYTTNGSIGVAGERLMKRKAEELNIVEVANKIENDILSLFHESRKEQTTQKPQSQSAAEGNKAEEEKGVGALTGRKPLTIPKEEKKSASNGIKTILIAAIAVIAGIAGYIYFTGNNNADQEQPATENLKPESKPVKNTKEIESQTKEVPQKTNAKQTPQKAAAKKATQPAKDNNYEEGMKAYEAGNGVEAVKKFKASGSAQSQYMIGIIYENGCGSIGKNAMKARQAFKEAAKLGSEDAKSKL